MNFNNTKIDWNEVHKVINNANSIMLTTHENPDGDGLGSESGLYYHLKEENKDIRIINYSPLPVEYEYLNDDNIFECYDDSLHDHWIKKSDLVIIFDVGDFVRIRTLVNIIETYDIQTMNIDHHPHPDDNVFTHNIVNLSAAATGCMVYDYLKFARDKPIRKNSLMGIYTATMTDTGCFRYGNTDNKCHEIAIESLNVGIETHKIYQCIYENSTKSRIKLMGEFLSNLNYELGGSLAWFTINEHMMKVSNATKYDVDGFTDMVRSIRGVEVALMIFQHSESSCRINFRSKGKYIINDIAKKIGGGGHAFAAGAVVDGVLNDVVSEVVKITINSIEKKMVTY
ncbi:MAG: DHH family phosphoesterase [Candidatus Neomarinimicrobiota bacterium]